MRDRTKLFHTARRALAVSLDASLVAVMGFSLCANGGVVCFFVGVLCLGMAVGWAIGGWGK